MMYDFSGLRISAAGEVCLNAAKLFAEEIEIRTGKTPEFTSSGAPIVAFEIDESIENKDAYTLALDENILTVKAKGIRGLIFGFSSFLRKIDVDGEKITLIKDISGEFSPLMTIRGHQLGYRDTPNTYDAWEPEDYHRYYRDMMFFGTNMVEHIPGGNGDKRNKLMKYDPDDMLMRASKLADDLDMDVSVWFPNENNTIEETVERRADIAARAPRMDVIFPPGGDPGDYDADEFIERVRAISKGVKAVRPDIEMWPSAQKPHEYQNWGELFIEEMEKEPEEIDGIITGPNWALPLDELRRRLPYRYPIRLYPDITHNVRCEYPVHFPRDDWHFAMTVALSRESVNPRPVEYRLIHRLTRPYIIGSVSYSEGVHDDLNKMIWADMDYFGETSLRESIRDYCRVFFWGAPTELLTDAIFGLEQNWYGDPAENGHIENTLRMFETAYNDCPQLHNNWRFIQLLFRAKCDMLVKKRRIFELALIDSMTYEINKKGDIAAAKAVLETDYNDCYKKLREDLEIHAKQLFELIGLQLDIARYGAKGAERGATLETIDLPLTDRKWLLNRLEYAEKLDESERVPFIKRVLNRNKVAKDEYYFSFAEHGTDVLGIAQTDYIYYNFQGDRPNINTGEMPTCMFKMFDSLTFRAKLGGFTPGCDYKLRVSFQDKRYPVFIHHYVKANGVTIYDGKQFGGEENAAFDAEMLAPGFVTATYDLPASVFENGCIELEIGEGHMGVMLSEFWIIRA